MARTHEWARDTVPPICLNCGETQIARTTVGDCPGMRVSCGLSRRPITAAQDRITLMTEQPNGDVNVTVMERFAGVWSEKAVTLTRAEVEEITFQIKERKGG